MLKPYNVEYISYTIDLNDEPNKDMDEDLVDNLEMFGHQEGGSSSERKMKTSQKYEFREECKVIHTWVYSINVANERTRMKCKICEKYKAQGPWGIGTRCNTIQCDAMVTHSKYFIHQTSIQKKLYETQRLTKSIPQHIMGINEAD
jgi:hypothetical protein